jgi:hypothetical protein
MQFNLYMAKAFAHHILPYTAYRCSLSLGLPPIDYGHWLQFNIRTREANSQLIYKLVLFNGNVCMETNQLSVAEMRMLRWCCGHTRRDRVRNDDIRDRVGVAPIEEKLIQHRLRWFGHVHRRPPEAPVRSGVLKRADNVKSGRGRPKLTWDESVKRDLKEWNISKDLAMDRSAWRLAINVPEP